MTKGIIFLSLFMVMVAGVASPISLLDAEPYTNINVFKLDPATATQRLLPWSVQQRQAHSYLRGFFAVWDPQYLKSQKQYMRIQQNFQNCRQFMLGNTLYASNFKTYNSNLITNLFSQWRHAIPAKQHAAIIIRETNVRALPSVLPMFKDYRKAGNGYPFDMNQAQKLWVGHPVAVLEYTPDWHWVFVVFDGGMGWIDARDMALVSHQFIHHYPRHRFAAIIRDNVGLHYRQHFLFDSRIGQIFPVSHGKLLVPVAGFLQTARFIAVNSPHSVWTFFPLSMTPKHALQIITQMLGQPYDWGGYYNFRDCSLTMISFFTPVGRMLPRSSDEQKAMGHYIYLGDKSLSDKQHILQTQGKPFLTLVGLEGHVMLYVGRYHGRSYVFQDSWGLHVHQNGRSGRAVIGKTVITPLTLGEHVPGIGRPQWSDIQSITLLN